MKRLVNAICIILLGIIIIESGLPVSYQTFAEETDTALTVGQTKQATEITKDGITFHFSEERTIGKFANGDFWVLAPVTITKISPDYDGHNNGWEVNPVVEGGHGFQDGGYGGGFDPSLVPGLPYTAEKTLSIVKTTPSGINRPCIKKAVVLTVVDVVPSDNGRAVFRPPYVGTEKPFYKVADLRTDLLPSYEPVANMPTLESIAKRFSSLQMDHKRGGIGRSLRPQDNMMDYQPKNTADQNNAVLRFMMNDPIEDKLPALINFVQFGIDHIHTMYLGQTWPDGGGHQPGHRIVLAFAATMLDIQKAKEELKAATFFHGMKNFTVGKNTEGLVLWGDQGANRIEQGYWSYVDKRSPNSNKSVPDPYGYIDGGAVGGYQIITSQSHKGEILATHLMPILKEAWNMDEWDMISTYADRWVYHGQWTQPDPIAPFDGNNSNFGITYGPDKDTGIPIAGFGRFNSTDGAHRDGGLYRSSYVASMWDTYRYTADGTAATPPFVIVSYPFSESISARNLSNTIELKAKAFGINTIGSVQFQVDGQSIGAAVTMPFDSSTNTYRYLWDISNIPNGTYSVSAIATDKKGNTTTSMSHEIIIREEAEATTLELIADPSPIVSIANGAAKTTEALMLPGQITVLTNNGAVKGDVAWDVQSCSYMPSDAKEQTFSITGDVLLPTGVINPTGIPLKTEITVTVNAATGSDKILESISAPAKITGIANGTPKTAEALGLPEQVVITTDGGRMFADIRWEVEKCSYNPENVNSQTFDINGLISLPAGVVNTKGRTIKTSVNVTVYADDLTDKTLASITTPTPVGSVPNGTAKTAAALGLPATVTMVTDGGSLQASVNWNMDSCTYDPQSKESQTFEISGMVNLPPNVINPNKIPLTVSIQVTVNKTVTEPTPTSSPTPTPTQKPSPTPTQGPSPTPTQGPSQNPSTPAPTKKPTPSITPKPTKAPTQNQNLNSDPASTENLITTDYPEMVRLLELLYESADIRDNSLNPTYGVMMKREPVITLTAGYQENLRGLAKLTFPDIRGDEWFASHIPLAVYRKLINGFPDGTFKGGNLISRAEVLTMLARFNSSEEMIRQNAERDAESWIRLAEQIGNDWYTHYVVAAKDGMIYPEQYTRDILLKPMTRGEVIYALANFLWHEDIHEDGKYHNMAKTNENPAFTDTVKTIFLRGSEGAETNNPNWFALLANAAEKPENGVPMDFYPSIICLRDKGILLGNNGESKWQNSISRAEVLALFERLAKVWGEESN